MSKSARLKALLANGYFPEELPPPFNTFDFARFRSSVGTAWQAIQQDYPKTTPEVFSVPKQRAWRRDLSVVNPVAQFHVAKIIADNWITLRGHVAKHSVSAEPLDIQLSGGRAVPKPDFELVRVRHSEVTAMYDFVLVTDISRFYGTLYTHAVPWGLHGKSWCKANLNRPAYTASLGAKLDRAVRKGNDNQTIGIPVGPDTSRIISEVVASAIDAELQRKLKVGAGRAVRHVDDWFIGFDTLGDAEGAVAVLSVACRNFQLEIHPEKTRCVHMPQEVEPIWPNALRALTLGAASRSQRRAIDHYFGEAFNLASLYPKQNVLSFAVSRSRSMSVRRDDWHTYETYLLKTARSNSTTLPLIVQILASYNAWGYPVGKERIAKLIRDLITKSAPPAHHAEVAWALFLAKALSITLPASCLSPVSELESSVCALLALDLRSRTLIDGKLNTSLWQQSMNEQGLVSNMWLLSYEAELKGWLSGATSYVAAHPYFGELRKRGISFYDTRRNVKDIRKTKPKTPSDALTKLLEELALKRDAAIEKVPLGQVDVRPGGFGGYGGDY